MGALIGCDLCFVRSVRIVVKIIWPVHRVFCLMWDPNHVISIVGCEERGGCVVLSFVVFLFVLLRSHALLSVLSFSSSPPTD